MGADLNIKRVRLDDGNVSRQKITLRPEFHSVRLGDSLERDRQVNPRGRERFPSFVEIDAKLGLNTRRLVDGNFRLEGSFTQQPSAMGSLYCFPAFAMGFMSAVFNMVAMPGSFGFLRLCAVAVFINRGRWFGLQDAKAQKGSSRNEDQYEDGFDAFIHGSKWLFFLFGRWFRGRRREGGSSKEAVDFRNAGVVVESRLDIVAAHLNEAATGIGKLEV